MRATHQLLRFGVFELNLDTEELRKDGIPMKLPPQPFAILALLAGRSGQLVTREDIQKQIWGEGTFVDFEHGLNQCIKQIRTALNDNTERPVYVETVPRRGYRFLAPVVCKTVAAPAPKVVESKSGIQPSPEAAKSLEKPPIAETYGAEDGALPLSKLEPVSLAGKTVSHYRVLNIIGGGGMGVVYKAEDLKLPRAVALKFLPEEVRNDPVALEQFAREARSASVLDHPNICSIYEFGEHGGRPFIVMQLLEGQTLRDLLTITDEGGSSGKALPLDQLLSIAIQTTDGLEAAHEKSIIHRDIKPANIFITTKGVAKILDFGLVKPIQAGEKDELAAAAGMQTGSSLPSSPSPALSPTFQSLATGTAAYMSPEQVRGEKLDARTDLFSFGLVLYEMATGRQAFHADSVAGLQDAILNSTPTPAQEINPALPDELQEIVQKCMQRDRELRYQHAADIRSDLEKIRRETQQPYAFRHWKLLTTAALLAIALLASGIYWRARKAATLTEKDTIVVADFNNTTGEAVFDVALKQALTSDLEQSIFLNVLSDQRVSEQLRFMGGAPNTRLTTAVARQVCQRSSSKVLLVGSISALGKNYLIALRAINCATGDSLGDEQEEASSREEVVRALRKATARMREKLGESLASVEKFNKPLEEATTTSLEALRAYSLGMVAKSTKSDQDALPFFKRAIELDPNFAMAYVRLGIVYSNLNQPSLAAANMAKAYQLRDSTSEKEKLYITGQYYSKVKGDLNQAREAYLLLQQTYPRDPSSYLSLTSIFTTIGNFDQALSQLQAARALNPGKSVSYGNFSIVTSYINTYISLDRFPEAAAELQRAEAEGAKAEAFRTQSYLLAFFQGDTAEMARQLALAGGQPGSEAELLAQQSDTEAYFGHLRKARELSQRARDVAVRAGATDNAALYQVYSVLQEAELGDARHAAQEASQVLAGYLNTGYAVQAQAVFALARSGDHGHALALADKLGRQFPDATVLNYYWLPAIRGSLALDEKDPQAAIDALQTAVPYELGSPPSVTALLYPVYMRGLAFLEAGRGAEAAGEFQKILDHRGLVANFPTAALAHLQLGRAQALMGNKEAARKSYQDFLTIWKDADPDLPVLAQAKAEYARLQ